MDTIKKTGIVAGAVLGGVVGGSISLVGKLAKVKVIDDVGSSVVSSSILMGGLVGNAASGAVDAVSGKVMGDSEKTKEGLDDMAETGKALVNNVVENVKYIADSGVEIASGIQARDKPRVIRSTKKLVKWAAVGAITVGVVKMTDADEKPKSDTEFI